MATIYNSDLSKELVEGAKIQHNRDNVPNRLGDTVVPVMEVNSKLLRKAKVIGIVARTTTATAVAAYTSPAGKKTFITGMDIDNYQDVNSDNTNLLITGTFDGESKRIYTKNKPTTTVSNIHENIIFNPPLEIDKNTSINYTLAFTAGASTLNISIYGYVIED